MFGLNKEESFLILVWSVVESLERIFQTERLYKFNH
jgi:hypothetical protein